MGIPGREIHRQRHGRAITHQHDDAGDILVPQHTSRPEVLELADLGGISVARWMSPWAWRPMTIGCVQPSTSRGTFSQMIDSRKMVPSRRLRSVPFGLRYIRFRLNSVTRASSGVMVAHFTPPPYWAIACAASTVTWSSVCSRYSMPRSYYFRPISRYGRISLSLMNPQMMRVISSPSSSRPAASPLSSPYRPHTKLPATLGGRRGLPLRPRPMKRHRTGREEGHGWAAHRSPRLPHWDGAIFVQILTKPIQACPKYRNLFHQVRRTGRFDGLAGSTDWQVRRVGKPERHEAGLYWGKRYTQPFRQPRSIIPRDVRSL